MSEAVSVRYIDGRAEVEIAGRRMAIDRRDRDEREQSCPIEFLSIALGS